MGEPGHNSAIPAAQLRQFVERAERLHGERQALGEDLSELFKEAKGQGFCTKTIKRVIAARRKDRSERQEEDAIFDLYMGALEVGERA